MTLLPSAYSALRKLKTFREFGLSLVPSLPQSPNPSPALENFLILMPSVAGSLFAQKPRGPSTDTAADEPQFYQNSDRRSWRGCGRGAVEVPWDDQQISLDKASADSVSFLWDCQ